MAWKPWQIDTELNQIEDKGFDFRITNEEYDIEYETKDKKDYQSIIAPPQQPATSQARVSTKTPASPFG